MSEPYFTAPGVTIWNANALDLPLPDASVDLIVTSPPYFGLRSYQDGGEHYSGQIGSEATPAEFLDALIAATREMVRVLKPSGSIWVNLGDKYAAGHGGSSTEGNGVNITVRRTRQAAKHWAGESAHPSKSTSAIVPGFRPKSLMGMPWRYALRCIDELGLILRAEVIWSKPNGLPESVTDRVRRSHEQWFHFTVQPRYFSAVDEIREAHKPGQSPAALSFAREGRETSPGQSCAPHRLGRAAQGANPLGKLPGSVWTVPTQPLTVPAELGIDHFAAFPMEWPRRIIKGWAPTAGVCTQCGEGRRPVAERERQTYYGAGKFRNGNQQIKDGAATTGWAMDEKWRSSTRITGYSCSCSEPTAPTTPAVVLDPFGGTGTTALVASVLGCHGHSVDLSADYCRLAQWRVTDPGQRAAAAQVEAVDPVSDDQPDIFDVLEFGEPA